MKSKSVFDVFKLRQQLAQLTFEELNMLKPRWPLVCSTCGSGCWVCAFYEDKPGGGDYCFDCKTLVKVEFITRSQYIKLYNGGVEISVEQFENMWRKDSWPKEGYRQ